MFSFKMKVPNVFLKMKVPNVLLRLRKVWTYIFRQFLRSLPPTNGQQTLIPIDDDGPVCGVPGDIGDSGAPGDIRG